MILPINDQYRINSDQHSWVIQESILRKKKGVTVQDWKSILWYPTLEMTVNGLAGRMLRLSEAHTLTDALAEVNNVSATLCHALHKHYQVKARDIPFNLSVCQPTKALACIKEGIE